MLLKAADHQGPPIESITHFGWEIRDDIPIPVIAQGDPELIDVIQCQCRAQGKKCSTEACGCHKQHLSCTSFCNCSGDESCCNPHTTREDAQAGDDLEMMLRLEMMLKLEMGKMLLLKIVMLICGC